MPAPADPFYVFHRIKGELMRLMYIESMRTSTENLIAGLTKVEARYTDAHKQHVSAAQQLIVKKTKSPKLTREQQKEQLHEYNNAFEEGRQANLYHNSDADANPYEVDTHKHKGWLNGWTLESKRPADQRAGYINDWKKRNSNDATSHAEDKPDAG